MAQNKKTNFYSDYQFDKTFDGTKLEGFKKVSIQISDPKLLTKSGIKLEDLPRGFVTIKFDGLDKVTETIVYLKKRSTKTDDMYAITNSETGNDMIFIIKGLHKVGKKSYSHTIVLGGNEDNDNYEGGLPRYYTAFHCNITK